MLPNFVLFFIMNGSGESYRNFASIRDFDRDSAKLSILNIEHVEILPALVEHDHSIKLDKLSVILVLVLKNLHDREKALRFVKLFFFLKDSFLRLGSFSMVFILDNPIVDVPDLQVND